MFPDGKIKISPDLTPRHMVARASYINSCTGLSIPPPDISQLLHKMSLGSSISAINADVLSVEIPATRPDILHECDIMEDAAVAFGFNNLPDAFPKTSTVAQSLPVSRISDIVRREWALAGWVEVLPLILVGTVNGIAIHWSLTFPLPSVLMKRTSDG